MEMNYDTKYLLDRAYEEIDSIMRDKKASITPPKIEILNRKTYVTNIEEVSKSVNRNVSDVMQYINSELAVATSICTKGLKITGVFKVPQIRGVLSDYIKKFVLCESCKSKNTSFETINRQRYLICKNCKCEVCK